MLLSMGPIFFLQENCTNVLIAGIYQTCCWSFVLVDILKNININRDNVIFKNVDIKKVIFENIDIDKKVVKNINIDKGSNKKKTPIKRSG